MGYGVVDEEDFNVITNIITEHKTKKQLIEATNKLEPERRERPLMICFVAAPRCSNISIEWARAWMPNKGSLHKDVTLHWC